MIAALVTVGVFLAVALPAFVAGVQVGRGQRRPRGQALPVRPKPRPREVIRGAERIAFGNDPAGRPKVRGPQW